MEKRLWQPGWNVTLWIYGLKSLDPRVVVRNAPRHLVLWRNSGAQVEEMVEKYEDWSAAALEQHSEDLFATYSWVWCRYKAGKHEDYKQCKPWGAERLGFAWVLGPRSDPSHAQGRLQQDCVAQELLRVPKDVPWVVDGLIQVHFDVREEGGQVITSVLDILGGLWVCMDPLHMG